MATALVEDNRIRSHSAGPTSRTRLAGTAAQRRKRSANLVQLQTRQQETRHQPSFGICFDVDGVLARGTKPIPAAVKGFKKLVDDRGEMRFPVAFVTNSLSRSCDKVKQLSAMLGVQVTADQLIQAPSPLEVFTKLHEKFCLIIGQGKVIDIARDLGFKNVCTVEDIAEAHPLLDVVDHDNRAKLAANGYVEKEFPQVEAVILLGEPKRWESALQILVDVLRSEGKPNETPSSPRLLYRQVPVIACNMDLQFQHSASMPRYGHGAFLVCLEALYKKISGRDLQYTALVGKPSEITFRFAEHVLTSQSRKLGFTQPLKTMYLVGDTPEVDILGTNLYQRYVHRLIDRRRRDTHWRQDSIDVPDSCNVKDKDQYDPELPESRNVPDDVTFHKQTVENVESILVCTGVYRPSTTSRGSTSSSEFDSGAASCDSSEEGDVWELSDDDETCHGHRDFPDSVELRKPTRTCDDVYEAITYVLEKESST